LTDRIARTIWIAALVVSVALASRASAAPKAPNGIAILYAKGPFAHHYEADATLALPRVRSQKSWYSVWMMLVADRGVAPLGFLQGGLIRWAGDGYALSAFVAFRRPGGSLVFRDLGKLRAGAHRVRLLGGGNSVRFQVDGKTLFEFSRHRYMPKGSETYLQVGAEVKAPFDRAVGTVWHLRLRRDGERRARRWDPACIRYDRGLHFVRVGYRFVADGYFNAALPSGFIGCREFGKG